MEQFEFPEQPEYPSNIAPNAAAETKKRKAKQKPEQPNDFFELKVNTNIYVQGLPDDVTVEELDKHFSKCGIVKRDPQSGQLKIKIYRDRATGAVKGDGLISYLRPESVPLAVNILDGSYLREKTQLKVEPAKFEKKGEAYVPKAAPAKKLVQKQAKALAWGFNEKEAGPRVVVLKHMFDPKDGLLDPDFYKVLKQELKEECQKLGEVQKIKVFERNKEGVVQVRFSNGEEAQKCIDKMEGRFFDGRKLEAQFWDGITDYRVKETKEEEQARLDSFGKWLEDQSDDELPPEAKEYPKTP